LQSVSYADEEAQADPAVWPACAPRASSEGGAPARASDVALDGQDSIGREVAL
jgi:hypothetical protein